MMGSICCCLMGINRCVCCTCRNCSLDVMALSTVLLGNAHLIVSGLYGVITHIMKVVCERFHYICVKLYLTRDIAVECIFKIFFCVEL